MWLLEILQSIGGIGTELGVFNFVLVVVAGYLVRREYMRIRRRVDPVHDRVGRV